MNIDDNNNGIFLSICLPSYNIIILTFWPALNIGFSETVYDINIYSV